MRAVSSLCIGCSGRRGIHSEAEACGMTGRRSLVAGVAACIWATTLGGVMGRPAPTVGEEESQPVQSIAATRIAAAKVLLHRELVIEQASFHLIILII